MIPRTIAVTLAAALVLCAPSCLHHRVDGDAEGRTFGVYRCTIERPGTSIPQFRMLLFAQLPDRLHAELLGPAGGPRLILDAGGGEMALTNVAEKIAYAGKSDPEAVAGLIGVSVGVERLVQILLDGSDPAGSPAFTRTPEREGGLPESLELRAQDRSIRIVRLSRRAVREGASLGTGAPPAGVQVRPLDELDPEGQLP